MTVHAFCDQLRDVEASAPEVLVLDLRQLGFADSLAIGGLIAADKRSRLVVLITAPGPVERLLGMTGVDGRLEIRHAPSSVRES